MSKETREYAKQLVSPDDAGRKNEPDGLSVTGDRASWHSGIQLVE